MGGYHAAPGRVYEPVRVNALPLLNQKGEDRVRVVWDRFSSPRYDFALDDNIFFLRDIARQRYASHFDCFYLKMLRDWHRKYGTCFTAPDRTG